MKCWTISLSLSTLLCFLVVVSESFSPQLFTHTHIRRSDSALPRCKPWISSLSSTSNQNNDAAVVMQQDQQGTMEDKYDILAQEIIQTFHEKQSNHQTDKKGRLWLALAGAPGSGKTTVANRLVDRIHAHDPSLRTLVVPMDGYHLTQKEMAQVGHDMKRRGAPWTFHAERMYEDLALTHQSDKDVVLLPDYSRDISDPVPDKIKLEAHHDIIIIEGLYVLLGTLCQELDDPNSPTNQVLAELEVQEDSNLVDVRKEVQRWEPLQSLWDQTFFVKPPGDGFAENKRRLVERSLKTWTPAKTELWGGGTDREAATRRVEYNDERNGKLINCCERFASFVIENE